MLVAAMAQYPHHFSYDDEVGLPSNEVYSIVQDKKGFIWIGCDAGLVKFDGLHYFQYTCATQKSNSKTGLIVSAAGSIFCYNFKHQLFVLKDDSLHELPYDFYGINNLVADQQGNIFISHHGGISCFNENTGDWYDFKSYSKDSIRLSNNNFAKLSVSGNSKGIYSIQKNAVCFWNGKTTTCYPCEYFTEHLTGTYCLDYFNDQLWIFSFEQNQVLTFQNGVTTAISNPKLLEAINNRKITAVRKLEDDFLWIFTYQGVIRYNPRIDEAELFYPNYSFTDGLIDREGNYWFSTLQSGLFRIPYLNYVVWNEDNDLIKNQRMNRLVADEANIYFTSLNGVVHKMNLQSNEINTFSTGLQADIQSFDIEEQDGSIYFNQNNRMYRLNAQGLSDEPVIEPAIKTQKHAFGGKLVGSSHGLFWEKGKFKINLFSSWVYEILIDSTENIAWIATNEGIYKLNYANDSWVLNKRFLKEIQVRSIDWDAQKQNVYALTFNGEIYHINKASTITKKHQFEKTVLPNRLRVYKNNLLLATSKGLAVFQQNNSKIIWRNTSNGLVSNNVQDVLVKNNQIWLATGKGLQRIPLAYVSHSQRSLIYLKALKTIDKKKLNSEQLQLQEGQSLLLYPEVSYYSSNGNFQYAYKINDGESWTLMPGDAEYIQFDKIPSGDFEIQMKVIDQNGKNSENTLILKGNVTPKFYKNYWFLALLFVAFLSIVYAIYKWQLKIQHAKSQREIELYASKLTAIQSQMNPHFLFNALNSIQNLVLKGDIENTYTYITTFSNLVRKTLNYSDKEYIDFEQEVQLLELYLSLEKLRFSKQFEYTITGKNIEGFLVPPLLIQPFVENALIHGLLHKEGERKLSIHFELTDALTCIIEDNGVGREASKQINLRKNKQFESFSTAAIRKRFEILSHLESGNLGYEFVDLEKDGAAIGTKVILRIPVKHSY